MDQSMYPAQYSNISRIRPRRLFRILHRLSSSAREKWIKILSPFTEQTFVRCFFISDEHTHFAEDAKNQLHRSLHFTLRTQRTIIFLPLLHFIYSVRLWLVEHKRKDREKFTNRSFNDTNEMNPRPTAHILISHGAAGLGCVNSVCRALSVSSMLCCLHVAAIFGGVSSGMTLIYLHIFPPLSFTTMCIFARLFVIMFVCRFLFERLDIEILK